MTDWEAALCAALAPLGIPCERMEYGGEAETYFVFNGTDIPAAYSDDAPAHERILIQAHLFTALTHNTKALRKQIKSALHGAGFSYPSATDADEEGKQHIVFECETARETGV